MNGELAVETTAETVPTVLRREGELVAFPRARSETPVRTRSETPVRARSETPVRTRSEAAVRTRSEAAVRTRSEAAVRTRSHASQPARGSVRCVWTCHLQDGHACEKQVPRAVMQAAWRRELEQGRDQAGFFDFAWREEVWLGYGLPDGGVRGVYCPAHRAEREERLGYDPELAG